MGRLKLRRVNKRDTPIKTALWRRDRCRRLQANKHFHAFPEEADGEEINDKPSYQETTVRCKPVLHLSSPVFYGNPGTRAAPGSRISGHQVQVTSNHEAFKGCEMTAQEEEQNVEGTPESVTSSCMDLDTTFTFDNDDDDVEEEDYLSASTSSSSLPSPEMFRRSSNEQTQTFSTELLSFDAQVKNSTLLDVSHAEGINLYQPLNLSTIIDISAIAVENNSGMKRPKAEPKIHTDSAKLEDKAIRRKTTTKLISRKPILYKKKVSFKSPMIADVFETQSISATKSTTVQSSSWPETMRADEDPSNEGGNSLKGEVLQLTTTLRRPVKSSQETAKFFDFISDSDGDAFFRWIRERSVKLRRAPLFPLTAAKHTKSSVL